MYSFKLFNLGTVASGHHELFTTFMEDKADWAVGILEYREGRDVELFTYGWTPADPVLKEMLAKH
jgi:hypothetical protein